jgi:hypothetical protein
MFIHDTTSLTSQDCMAMSVDTSTALARFIGCLRWGNICQRVACPRVSRNPYPNLSKTLPLGTGTGSAGIPDVHQDIEASPELEGIYGKLLAINGGKFNLADQKGSICIIQRIYPERMGINSTDYEPHMYWGAGC